MRIFCRRVENKYKSVNWIIFEEGEFRKPFCVVSDIDIKRFFEEYKKEQTEE